MKNSNFYLGRSAPITLLFSLLFGITVSCQVSRKSDSGRGDKQRGDSNAAFLLSNKVKHKVNPDLFGFNTANFFLFYSGDNPSADTLLHQLGTPIYRFPGGTTANFYHFKGKGYGYNSPDAELVKGSHAYKNITHSIQAQKQVDERDKVSANYAQNFADLVKKMHGSALLVANILSGNDEENLQMIQYFIDQKVDIKGIEIGNEIYLKAYRQVFPDASAYITRARELALKIRAKYPQIKIAVVAAPFPLLKGANQNATSEFNDWNEKLGQENFYDAIVAHMYSKPKKCLADKNDKTAFSKCALEENTKYAYEGLMDAMKYYKQNYNNTPIWITEWNAGGVQQYFGNTFVAAAYYGDFLLNICEVNQVKLATYHNLLSRSSGYNIIGTEMGSGSSRTNMYITKVTFRTALLFKPLFSGKAQLLQDPAPLKTQMISGITVRAFETPDKVYLYIVNKSGHNFSLANLKIQGFENFSGIIFDSIDANSVSECYDSDSNDAETNSIVSSVVVQDIRNVNIAGYSVNRITFLK